MQTGLVILISGLYLAAIFAIAWWGDRLPDDKPLFRRASVSAAVVYALTLGIHTTAWSFYGNVGRATDPGFHYLPATLGGILFLMFGQSVLRRVIAVSKARHITSVSDFISARFGKRRPLAAFVALALLVGVLPYIALQLKAVAFSFDILTGASAVTQAARANPLIAGATDFWVGVTLAAFTMLFGIRHIHASERHRGFVLALAFDSLVKLVAFVGVAVFILYGMFDGLEDVLEQARDRADLQRLLVWEGNHGGWYTATAAAFLCYLCLPQIFHVAVVENDDPRSVRAAPFLYLAYVLPFVVFMTPIALAGSLVDFNRSVHPDTFLIALPMHADAPAIGLLAFIGGLSAAAGMTMVSAVALSTMLGNDVVLPFLLRHRQLQEKANLTQVVLVVRRALVAGVLLLAFAMQRLINENAYLVDIGVMSFIAAAQFAPAFFGGLYWRKASTTGVVVGMTLGFAVWFYALLLPSMATALSLSPDFVNHGPWNLDWLRPQNLFGLGFADPVTNTAVWSLTLNIGAFVLLSLLRPATQTEIDNALAFEHIAAAALVETGRADSVRDLADYAAQFVGADHADADFSRYVEMRAGRSDRAFSFASHVDDDALRFGETLIAGAIGAASARIVIAAWIAKRRRTRRQEGATLEDASAALRDKHELLSAITENVQQGICAFDTELRMTAWNSRFERVLDLPAGTFKVGMPLAEVIALNRVRGEYTPEELDRLIVNRDLATLTWPYVYERIRPDGTVLEVTFNRMDKVGYVATFVDVTDRHHAAQALRAANELLEERVRERTLALEQAKTEAERANADKTRFLAAASHDLLQPLTAARLFLSAQQAGLRERNAVAIDPGMLSAYADSALAALESTEGLLTELLYMSSLDARAITPKIQSVDINALLVQLRTELMPLATKRGLSLRVASTSLVGSTDAGLVRRVLQNFISNAIRYTSKGRVLIGCRRLGDRLRIEVWDTGVGIPEDMRDEIFLEFRRLSAGPSDSEPGAGLGLAIAERIARLLGATLTLRSKVGRGSVFGIEIPRTAVRSNARTLQRAPEADDADERGMLILCIDNDRRIRDGMKALLERWGHRAVCADGLETASVGLEHATPDIALVDYHLDGGRTGLEVVAALRPLWAHDVPVVIVTADRSEAVREATRAAGCMVLHKPVKPAALRRCVSEARRAGKSTEGLHEGRCDAFG